MSLAEIRDVYEYRTEQRNMEIYSLSGMIRTAIVTAFNDKTKFPPAPGSEESGDWHRSAAYLRAICKAQGGAK